VVNLTDRTMRSFRESPQFKFTFIFNSQNGSKKIGRIFHELHITENTVGARNILLYL